MMDTQRLQLQLRQTRAALKAYRAEGENQMVNIRKCLRGIARMKQELRAVDVTVIDELHDAPHGDEGIALYW